MWNLLPILLHAAREKPLTTAEVVAYLDALACDQQASAVWGSHFESLRGIAGEIDEHGKVQIYVPPLASSKQRGLGLWLAHLLAPDWDLRQSVTDDQRKPDVLTLQPIGLLTVDMLPDWGAVQLVTAAGQSVSGVQKPLADSIADLAAFGRSLVRP